MLIARLAVAACASLVLVGCGVGHSTESEPQTNQTATRTAAAERSDYLASDGVRRSLGNGVVLLVSSPKSFTPSETASPRAARAVAFEMVIDNGSPVTFRPAQLSFLATVDGTPTEQVIDSTQGYTGASGTGDEVAPAATLRFAVAFGVPKQARSVRVEVRPNASGAAPVELYDGTV